MRDSIRRRLALIFVGLAIVPLFLVGFVLIWQIYTAQIRQALVLQQQTAQHVATEVATFLHDLENELQLIGQIQRLESHEYAQQVATLDELLTNERGIDDIALLDNQGREVIHLSRSPAQAALADRSRSTEFQIPKATGRTYYSAIRFDAATCQPAMRIAVPLRDAQFGLMDGVLAANICLNPVQEYLAGLALEGSTTIYIVDAQGKLIAHHEPERVSAHQVFSPPTIDGTYTGQKGTRALLATVSVPLGTQKFIVVAERPVSEAYAMAVNTAIIIAALMAVALGIAIAAGMAMVRQIVQPIEALAKTAHAIRNGDFTQQANVHAEDEIGTLAQTFNAMVAQLRTTQGRLRSVIDTAPYYIFWKDSKSVYLGSNEAFARLAGLFSVREITGKTDNDLVWHAHAHLYRDTDIQVMTTGEPFHTRMAYHDPLSGSIVWLEVDKVPLRDAEGHITGILGTYHDVTERAKAEEAMRLSEEKFSKAFYASPNSITVSDLRTGKLLEINKGFERVFGYSREEALGKSTTELNLYANPADRQKMIAKLQAEGHIRALELVGRRKSNDLLIGILSVEQITLDGEACLVTIVRDATGERLAQKALVESEARYRSIVENALEGIFTIDDDYRFAYVNEELCRILDYDRAELTGMDFRDVLTEESRTMVADRYIRRQHGEDVPPRYELDIVRKDGDVRHAEMSVAVVRGVDGRPYSIGQIVDVSERAQAQALLQQGQMVIENSPVVIFRWRAAPGWPVEYVSDNIIQMGYTPEELLTGATTYMTLVHPDDLARVTDEVARYSRLGVERFQQEYRIVTKDGQVRWIDDRTTIERDAGGQVTHYQGIVVDITERKASDEAMRESRQMLETIMNNLPESIFWKDRNLIYLGCNINFARDAGFDTPEQVIGKTDYDLPGKELAERYRADDAQVIQTGKAKVNYEEPKAIPEGSTAWLRTTKVPLYNAAGEIYAILGAYTDITEKKIVQERLHMLSRAIEQIGEGVVIADLDNHVLYANPAWAKMHGYTIEEVLGNSIAMFHSDEQLTRDVLPFHEHVAAEGHHSGEVGHTRKDGTTFTSLMTTTYLRNDAGTPIGFVGTGHDITAEKEARAALRESERRLAEALNLAQMGYWAFDAATETFTFNDQYYKAILNATAEEVGGYRMPAAEFAQRFVVPEDAPLIAQCAQEVLESHDPDFQLQIESRNVTVDGEEVWVTIWATAERDPEGRTIGTRGVSQVITERKRAQMEREALITELETKNAELERFTYTVSHDLKSPLVTIRGFVGYLEQDARRGDMKHLQQDIDFVRNATDRMQQLLNDLLELSRIGRLINPPQDIPFADIIDEAVALVRGQLESRDIALTIAPEIPVVYGDRVRLVEVMQNLIDNAVRFMGDQPNPRIEIGTRVRDHETVFYVQDNGIGIDPRYHRKILDLFEQLNPNGDGTGIGLTLVKRIIEVHGGRIWVESEGRGQGSTFCFTLPGPEHSDAITAPTRGS